MLGREGENKCLLVQIVIEHKVLVLRDSSEGLWCANAALDPVGYLEMVKTVPVLRVLVARPANRHISWRIWREGSHHAFGVLTQHSHQVLQSIQQIVTECPQEPDDMWGCAGGQQRAQVPHQVLKLCLAPLVERGCVFSSLHIH